MWSGSNRTRWRCRCSPRRRGSGSSHRSIQYLQRTDRSTRVRRQWHLLQQHLRMQRYPAPASSPLCRRRVWRKHPRRQRARHRRRYLQQHRRPAVLLPRPHQLGGQSGRASRPLERCHRTRQWRRQCRPAVLLPLLRRWRGRLERSRQWLGPLVTAGRGRSARGVCGSIREGEYRCGG